MIDLHCHILPGIDDGPDTMEETLELARVAVAAGTTTVIATPHVSWDWPDVGAARIAAAVDEVNEALRVAAIDLEVRSGAEVALTRAGDLDDEELVRLRLGGGPWLLAECPLSSSGAGFEQALSALTAKGHRIVLAHPERSPLLQRDRELLGRLVGQGMLSSVTAGSLIGRFGRPVQDVAMEMVAAGMVHNIASDAHSAGRRPPGIRDELRDAGLGEQADWLGRAVPLAVVSGTKVPPMPPMPAHRKPGPLTRLFRRA